MVSFDEDLATEPMSSADQYNESAYRGPSCDGDNCTKSSRPCWTQFKSRIDPPVAAGSRRQNQGTTLSLALKGAKHGHSVVDRFWPHRWNPGQVPDAWKGAGRNHRH